MPTSPEIMNNSQNKEYLVTRLSRDNLGDLAILHSVVYGTQRLDDYFLKKYDTAYVGVENIGFIAYNRGNQPVAYYGVIPCFIQSGNEIILAAQSADTMTHPKHRYKGMFVELSNMTFELCRTLGIHLIYGFPNQNSYHAAVNKLGWQLTDNMAYFTITVKTLPLESFSRRSGLLHKLYQRYYAFILSKNLVPQQGLPNSVLADGFAGVYRSEEYLAYKAYNPGKVIGIADAKIWVSNKYGLLIGDIEGLTEVNFRVVIGKLKSIAKKLGVRQIQFHCSPGTSLYKLFAADYKPAPSYPMLFQDFGSVIPPANIKFTFADIDIF